MDPPQLLVPPPKTTAGIQGRKQPARVGSPTPAAKWNNSIMRLLRQTLRKTPEIDLTKAFPKRYSDKLGWLKNPGNLLAAGYTSLADVNKIQMVTRNEEPQLNQELLFRNGA
jgi:hypothetical protein